MIQTDILKNFDTGKLKDLETHLSKNTFEKPFLSQAFFFLMESRDFSKDHEEAIGLLLRHGLDLSLRDKNNKSLLMFSCFKNRPGVVKMLVAAGANAREIDRTGKTTVMVALNTAGPDPLESVKILAEKGADLFAVDADGATALHYAAYSGHHHSLDFLLRQGLLPNAQDHDKNTALHFAFQRDKKFCVDLLLNITNTSLKNTYGKSPLDDAHSKSLASLNHKKFAKEENWHDTRRGRGKGKTRGFTKFNGRNDRTEKYERHENFEKSERRERVETFENFEKDFRLERNVRENSEKVEKSLEKNEKGFGKNSRVSDSACLNCTRVTELFCLECAKFIIEKNNSQSVKELESLLALARQHENDLEKENQSLKETIQSKTFLPKPRLNPLYLTDLENKKQDLIIHCLQNDILTFITDQEHFLSKVNQPYQESVNLFKSLISESFPEASIEVFGSFSTGLLLPYSDIDIVITGLPSPVFSSLTLKDLGPKLDSQKFVIRSDKILTASIPVIKTLIRYKEETIKIDITVQEEKHKGIQCSNLVKKFLGSFNTIKQVYLVLKQLMFFCNFHEPYRGGISSYGLFLMVVFFYQERMKDWRFKSCDKEGNYSTIFIQFLEFYLQSFQFNRMIVIDYENWENKDLKQKPVLFK
jgi:predicted nucleotidyltransferase